MSVLLVICGLFATCGSGGGGDGQIVPIVPLDPAALDYDVVYVRYPRSGDTVVLPMPDGENPFEIAGGADLMLLHPDATEEILVDCPESDSIIDPIISYDAEWVYYCKYLGLKGGSTKPRNEAADCFLFKMRVDLPAEDRVEIQLTDASRDVETDKLAGNTDADLDEFRKSFGIRDLGPALLPDGRIVFTSNREALIPAFQGSSSSVNVVQGAGVLQLYVMDDHDGSTPNRSLQLIGQSVLHGAFHPIVLKDGRILFSNWDDAGTKSRYGVTTLYACQPDGTFLEGFLEPHNEHKRVDHFVTQLGSGEVVVGNYYPGAMWGFGILHRYPLDPAGPHFQLAQQKTEQDYRFFSRKGLANMTPHTGPGDGTAPGESGRYAMPAAGPGDVLWVAYSPGPVVIDAKKGPDRPVVDSGLYVFKEASAWRIDDPSLLIEIKNDPDYNEIWPRPVVPYRRVHGVDRPARDLPAVQNGPTRNLDLPPGSPTGYVGTSSVQNRESTQINGNDYFNVGHGRGTTSSGFVIQGTDVGRVENDDLHAIRVIAIVPDRYHIPYRSSSIERDGLLRDDRQGRHVKGYYTHTGEVWKILGEFPIRGPEGARGAGSGTADPDGEQDTSFLARIPANVPFLYQGIDRRGMTLFTEQTWRHVAPGRTLANCGGCHAHSIEPIPFANKKADLAAYAPWDLVAATPMIMTDAAGAPEVHLDDRRIVDIEFRRDIYPLLAGPARCGSCHTSSGPVAPPLAGGTNPVLALFDSTLGGFAAEVRAYKALAKDDVQEFAFGVGIPVANQYAKPQMSRYVRQIQARRSLLAWKIYGERLDGYANDEFPLSGKAKSADLDFTPGTCDAPNRLTAAEKGRITRWIDLACPIDLDDATRPQQRYTGDGTAPVVALEVTPAAGAGVRLHIGLLDLESGIDTATFALEIETAEGVEPVAFADLQFDFTTGVGTYAPAANPTDADPVEVRITVRDAAGNLQRVHRTIGTVR